MAKIGYSMGIGIGTRGSPEARVIPQPAGGGGGAPTVRAIPIHAVLGLIMKYHMRFHK